MKRLVVLAGLAAVLLGAAACNNSTPGQATAGTTTTESQPGATSTMSGAGSSGLPVDSACSLLSSGDLQQLGVSAPPKQEMVGTAHSCDFDSADFSMSVGLRTNGGLQDFTADGGTAQGITIGKHQAKQEVDTTGSCVIGIGVSDTSRVDVTVTPGDQTQDPCPTALKLANIVEPKLP